MTFVTPPAWKRAVGLTLASKDASRAEAIHRVPARVELFVRVKDDGRAEARLIGAAETHAQGRCAVSAEYERATIRAEWPAEFDDGARCGFLGRLESPHEPGGYPLGFHGWPLARRNAWFAGFNKGNCDRTILQKEMAQND